MSGWNGCTQLLVDSAGKRVFQQQSKCREFRIVAIKLMQSLSLLLKFDMLLASVVRHTIGNMPLMEVKSKSIGDFYFEIVLGPQSTDSAQTVRLWQEKSWS